MRWRARVDGITRPRRLTMASTRGKADSMVDNPLHSVKHAKLDSRTPSEFFDSMRGLDVESSVRHKLRRGGSQRELVLPP